MTLEYSGVAGSRIVVPDHDQRAIHTRISAKWVDTLAFINWFDEPYGAPHDGAGTAIPTRRTEAH